MSKNGQTVVILKQFNHFREDLSNVLNINFDLSMAHQRNNDLYLDNFIAFLKFGLSLNLLSTSCPNL